MMTEYGKGWAAAERRSEAELTRLQGVVDKLPKCWRLNDAGKLVQDVPVVPGMVLWFWDDADTLRSAPALVFVAGTLCSVHTSYGWVRLTKCYSTREAAQAAGGES